MISQVTVANSVSYSGGYGGAPGFGAGGGGTSTESCVVSFDAELYDAESQHSFWKINVTGKASVFLFAFEAALMQAIDESIINLSGYIQTGVAK